MSLQFVLSILFLISILHIGYLCQISGDALCTLLVHLKFSSLRLYNVISNFLEQIGFLLFGELILPLLLLLFVLLYLLLLLLFRCLFRVFRGMTVGSDHFLVNARILFLYGKNNANEAREDITDCALELSQLPLYNIDSLRVESTSFFIRRD